MSSTSYPADSNDWRGIFIRNMAGAIARQPAIDLKLWAPPGELPQGVSASMTSSEAVWLHDLMLAGGISHLMRQKKVSSILAPLKLLRLLRSAYQRNDDADIYHVNWLQCALALPRNELPVLLTVLGNDLKLLKLPLVRSFIRYRLRRRAVAICPNAEWMQEPLESAFGDRAMIVPVVFGIDDCWYQVHRNPDVEPSIWIIVSRLTKDKLGPVFEWGEQIFKGAKRELHLFGPMQENISIPDWVRYHGPASPTELVGDWFARAAGLITLSRHAEGRPQVILEAMASGVPIVASRLPAHESLVVQNETGKLCESESGFAAAVRDVEDTETNRKFGIAARERCRSLFGTWDDCAQRYIRLYERLVA
jgi:glycosyltransferase involved in cell wall biosynthesis